MREWPIRCDLLFCAGTGSTLPDARFPSDRAAESYGRPVPLNTVNLRSDRSYLHDLPILRCADRVLPGEELSQLQ
jgi:hypothetical protein